ncbi:MAG: histidine kinase [Chitinophagaceae bacterium]|nr:histidine kinase [Chitinophagaceae bacterium]
MNRSVTIFLHVLGCLVFICIPVMLSPGRIFGLDDVRNTFALRDVITYALLIIFFYVHYYYLIPEYYFKKNYPAYVLVSAICIVLIMSLPVLLIKDTSVQAAVNVLVEQPRTDPPFLLKYKSNIFLFLVILFASLAMRVNIRWRQSQREKISSELSFLKAQINPHFLFNSLNTIHSLALQQSDYTSEAVVKLSGMMRYVLSDAREDFVTLEKEITYIQNFIDLQKARFGDTADVYLHVSAGIDEEKKIAPMILITFIENAFKHGVNPEVRSEIDINITTNGDWLTLLVSNLKVHHKSVEDLKTGQGLANVKKQLEYLYAARYELKITDSENTFIVRLKLLLND